MSRLVTFFLCTNCAWYQVLYFTIYSQLRVVTFSCPHSVFRSFVLLSTHRHLDRPVLIDINLISLPKYKYCQPLVFSYDRSKGMQLFYRQTLKKEPVYMQHVLSRRAPTHNSEALFTFDPSFLYVSFFLILVSYCSMSAVICFNVVIIHLMFCPGFNDNWLKYVCHSLRLASFEWFVMEHPVKQYTLCIYTKRHAEVLTYITFWLMFVQSDCKLTLTRNSNAIVCVDWNSLWCNVT